MFFTVTGLLFCLAIAFACYKKHLKKTNNYKAPIVPWIIISIAFLSTGFMLLVHLVNLFGFETGNR